MSTEQSSDMMERVAQAISRDRHGLEGRWPHYKDTAKAALEVSHHVELVEALRQMRDHPTCPVEVGVIGDAVLAKIGDQ